MMGEVMVGEVVVEVMMGEVMMVLFIVSKYTFYFLQMSSLVSTAPHTSPACFTKLATRHNTGQHRGTSLERHVCTRTPASFVSSHTLE